MWKGYKQELKHEDLYATPEESLSQVLHQRFNKLVANYTTEVYSTVLSSYGYQAKHRLHHELKARPDNTRRYYPGIQAKLI